MTFFETKPLALMEQELDFILLNGTGYENGKFRVSQYFSGEHTGQEKTKFLAKEYGIGGRSWTFQDGTSGFVWYDSKGVFARRSGIDFTEPEFHISWTKAAIRVDELVIADRYLTEEEKAAFRSRQEAEPLPESTLEQRIPTVREIHEQFLPVIKNLVLEDAAYQNACKNSDPDNAYLEGNEAVKRAALSVNDTVFQRLYFDNPTFHRRLHQDVINDTYPLLAGLPPAQETEEVKPEVNLTPNVKAYWDLKAQYPDKLVGVQVGEYMLFYGQDAEAAAPALGTKLLVREIPGLGSTAVTGSPHAWQATLKHLLEHGQSVVLAQPESGQGIDAPYEIIKERDTAEYIPLGMILNIEGHQMRIDSVDFQNGTVYLSNADLQGSPPILREEPIPYIRQLVEDAQMQEFSYEEMAVWQGEQPLPPEPVRKRSGQSLPERNYRTFAKLFPEISSGEYRYLKLEAGASMMPLHIERIGTDVISVSHTYTQNGDIMYDPEMTFRINPEKGTLEPLTFRQDGGFPIYQEVYPEPGRWIPKLRKDLNAFAKQWLQNISTQQYLKHEAVVERNGEDVRFTFDQDGKAIQPDTKDEPHYKEGDRVVIPAADREISGEIGYIGDKEVRIDTGPYSWSHETVERSRFEEGLRQDGRNAELLAPPVQNFRITDDNLGAGGAKAKFAANLEAIRLLKAVEVTDRPATPEEQEILSRYVGWGGVQQAFDETSQSWSGEYRQLRDVLTEEEYIAARGSVLNAHYARFVP